MLRGKPQLWEETMLLKMLAGVALAAGLSLSATAAFAETVTIRYSNWLPANFFLWDDVVHPWLKEIEQVTEGRVKVEVSPKVVGTVSAQYDVVRDGLADLSWMVAGYTPGRFPMIELGDLPLIGPDAAVLAPAFDRTYRARIARHGVFEGVEPLSLLVITPLQVVTKGKPVASVDGLAGLKLRSSSVTLTEVLKLVGAVPILKSAAEAYEMLATGTIDGQVTNLNTIPGFNQLDLMDGVYHVPGGLANSVIVMGLNADKWAEISEQDREAIMAISGEVFARKVGEAYDKADKLALEKMRAANYRIAEASDEQIAELKVRLKPLEDAWIARARAAGLADAQEVLDAYKAEVAKSY
jgi:TRAP-type C4-dicarboxylate transport system substrate-binding protein